MGYLNRPPVGSRFLLYATFAIVIVVAIALVVSFWPVQCDNWQSELTVLIPFESSTIGEDSNVVVLVNGSDQMIAYERYHNWFHTQEGLLSPGERVKLTCGGREIKVIATGGF